MEGKIYIKYKILSSFNISQYLYVTDMIFQYKTYVIVHSTPASSNSNKKYYTNQCKSLFMHAIQFNVSNQTFAVHYIH